MADTTPVGHQRDSGTSDLLQVTYRKAVVGPPAVPIIDHRPDPSLDENRGLVYFLDSDAVAAPYSGFYRIGLSGVVLFLGAGNAGSGLAVLGGGDATLTTDAAVPKTVTGMLSTDTILFTITSDVNMGAVTYIQAVATTDTATFTPRAIGGGASAPTAPITLRYLVLRLS